MKHVGQLITRLHGKDRPRGDFLRVRKKNLRTIQCEELACDDLTQPICTSRPEARSAAETYTLVERNRLAA